MKRPSARLLLAGLSLPLLARSEEPWQDAAVFEINRLPMRAQTWPCPDAASALASSYERAPGLLCLDGPWSFRFSPDPQSRPADFFKPDYDAAAWKRIPVPSCWERCGYGTPLYVNYTYPFKADPPFVMGEPPKTFTTFAERNPVGSYRTTFQLPDAADGRRVIIHFGGVSSAYFFWVNGVRAGYAEDARLPSEFDITDLVRSGANTLAVEVYKYSDGSYLEDQDFWRLSGIFRDIFVYTTPDVSLWDVYFKTDLDLSFSAATLTPKGSVRATRPAAADELSLAVEVRDPGGKTVVSASATEKRLPACETGFTTVELGPIALASPQLWCAETPNLYTALLILKRRGHVVDVRKREIGLRQAGLLNGQFAVNGRAIKIKGVNRHEFDPEAGYVQTRARIEQDVRLIKQANFNFVRAAHYPCDPRFYDTCDRLGLYVLDEANVESHGLSYHKRVLPGDRPEWRAPTVSRGERMALRDRGYACVVFWSLGNEAGYGSAFPALRDAIRAADPEGRPIQYADMNLAADVDSQTYPTPEWLGLHLLGRAVRKGEHGEQALAAQHGPYPSGKPFLMNEYCHAMGNSLGNFQEYWDLIEANPMLIGGFIWDWVDQGLWKTLPGGARILAYGGDFGDQPNNGNFCCNGLVGPERDPHPHYWQAAKTHQPVCVRPGSTPGAILVTNKHEVLSTAPYRLTWRLERDGQRVREGAEEALDIPAGGAQEVRLPIADALGDATDASLTLTAAFTLKSSNAWAAAGHRVAWDQLVLREGRPPAAPAPAAKKSLTATPRGSDIVLAGDSCSFVFSGSTGALASWTVNGRERLAAPLALNFWRAPTDNDEGCKLPAKSAVWRRAAEKAALRSLQVSPQTAGEVTAELSLAAGASSATLVYTCTADGRIDLAATVTLRPAEDGKPLPLVPKIGLQAALAGRHACVRWFGKGPHENYWDRQDATWLGIHSLSVAEFTTRYVRPQENANRCGVRWIEFRRDDGSGVRAAADGQPLMASAWPYTQADLEAARHDAELPARDLLTVNLDHLQMGVGGDNSWGLPVHAPYTIPAAGTYSWKLTLQPL